MNKSWKQKFLTISIGQMASLIGSSAVQFSLIWWIASETGSPIMMGLSGLAAFLPATLLSPAAGIAADRYLKIHLYFGRFIYRIQCNGICRPVMEI